MTHTSSLRGSRPYISMVMSRDTPNESCDLSVPTEHQLSTRGDRRKRPHNGWPSFLGFESKKESEIL